MKTVGALLIFLSALCGYLRCRYKAMLPLKLARALVADLAVLRNSVYISRRPLPFILAEDLREGLGAEYLWKPFGTLLGCASDGAGSTVRESWIQAVWQLPVPFSSWLLPLGPFFSAGGNSLAQVIDEIREELICYIRAGEKQCSDQLKLSAALYFSAACLVVLILL